MSEEAANVTMEELQEAIEALEESYSTLSSNLDNFWLLYGAVLVFFMQAGFACLEAGSISSKSVKNVLMKNTCDACLGGIIFWAVGYSFAYGERDANQFIGSKNFFMEDEEENGSGYYAGWMFQWAFAATAATIVSGAVAERCRMVSYLVYTTLLIGFIYPVVVHWVWSSRGWLSAFHYKEPVMGANGLVDFAGSGVVHMTGGAAALMGAIIIGPRMGRFDADGTPVSIPGHSTSLFVLGTLILWFGWYGFNPVSTLSLGASEVAARAAVTTTLSACSGGLTAAIIEYLRSDSFSIEALCNGLLGGLVSITASCPVVRPYAAFIIGIIGGIVYIFSADLILALKIDDALNASPVHFFCGMWGVISVGVFGTERFLADSGYVSPEDEGFFYGLGGKQLGVQLVGVLAITGWVCTLTGIMFFLLNMFGLLRIDKETEEAGLDSSHHGGDAYNIADKKSVV